VKLKLFVIDLTGFVHREKLYFLWENLLRGNFSHSMDMGPDSCKNNFCIEETMKCLVSIEIK